MEKNQQTEAFAGIMFVCCSCTRIDGTHTWHARMVLQARTNALAPFRSVFNECISRSQYHFVCHSVNNNMNIRSFLSQTQTLPSCLSSSSQGNKLIFVFLGICFGFTAPTYIEWIRFFRKLRQHKQMTSENLEMRTPDFSKE